MGTGIKHSTLAEVLNKRLGNGDITQELLRVTADGVWPEGGAGPLQGTGAGIAVQSARFKLGPKSLQNLQSVHPRLVDCVKLAIQITTVDFTVYDGVRSLEEQRQNVARGVSKTMDSKHMIQSDSYGHAVDLVPIIDGIPKWDWEGCYAIACAMDDAATQLNAANHIVWGGCWDLTLADYGGDANVYRKVVEEYKSRHNGPDFIDGPHFEWRN